jgi:hypothetical protein
MSSLEECFDQNEPLHSAIISDRGLFAPVNHDLGLTTDHENELDL